MNTVGPFNRGLVTIPPGKVEDLQMVLAAMQATEGKYLPDRFLAKVGGKLISVRAAFAPAKLWSAEFFWALDMPNKFWWGAKILINHARDGRVSAVPSSGAELIQRSADLVAMHTPRSYSVGTHQERWAGVPRSGHTQRIRSLLHEQEGIGVIGRTRC